MTSVPELVQHYDTLDSTIRGQSLISALSSSKCTTSELQTIEFDSTFQLDIPSIMFSRSRSTSRGSSTKSDTASLSTSPTTSSTYESPASIHSSPTFSSIDSFKYQGTSSSHRKTNLPQFSMASMHGLMRPQTRSQPTRPSTSGKRWPPRRTLSQTVMDMELECQGNGIEATGLGLFEPRPMETIVSRQATQSSMILDGILEVMSSR